MAGVLNGIKVLDFSQVYSGPFCTLLLRDLGAEIIKVERLEGDVVRNDAPLTRGLESGTFIILNRGKQSITVNLKSDKGREICRELAKQVDVLVENFSPGTMDKLGLGSEELCKLNPGLVYASISAYGHTGPRRDEIGYDPVIQAMGGLTSVTGTPEMPVKCAVAVADFSAGLFTAFSIVAALMHRLKTGEGQVIDTSLQDAVWLLTSIEFSPHYFIDGKVPPRMGNGHPAMTPGNLYPARDGSVIIATGALGMTERLYTVMGREDLIGTPLSANQKERIKYREQIDSIVSEWTKTKSAENIVSLLKEAGVPCVRVPGFDEVCNDQHLKSREMIIQVEQTVSGKVTVPGSPFKMSRTPGDIRFPAPYLGEHNHKIFSDMLDYSEREIERLVEEGVV